MLSVRARITVAQPDDDTLIVRSNPTRRGLFGAIALLLVFATIVGFDSSVDLRPPRLAGTILFAVLIATTAGVALWDERVVIARSAGQVLFRTSIAGIPLKLEEKPLATLTGVILVRVELMKGGDGAGPAALGRGLGSYVERRGTYHRLILDFGRERRTLENGTNHEELAAIGGAIGAFCGLVLQLETQ